MLNPESITILDPACGSGHILVEAYDLMKAIYLEAGYRLRDIPRLILEKNLYGLDIDERAAQMAGFALLMKARADDRRILENPPRLNVLAVRGARGEGLGVSGEDYEVLRPFFSAEAFAAIPLLLETFAEAKTFGSLIQIPASLDAALPGMVEGLRKAAESGDVFAQPMAEELLPLVWQAGILGMKFDAVVANPPYMGGKGMNPVLKEFAKKRFPDSKSDLFSMFIERGFEWCNKSGFNSMITMHGWMFLSSFEAMRKKLLINRTIQTMAHLGARAFSEISGEVVQTAAVIIQGQHLKGFKPVFFRLIAGQEEQKKLALQSGSNRFDNIIQDDFMRIPGMPLAYWVKSGVYKIFKDGTPLFDYARPRQGMATTNDELFLRLWHEVSCNLLCMDAESRKDAISSQKKWFPFLKGGEYRKWYGNNEYVVNFKNDGEEVCTYIDSTPGAKVGSNGRIINRETYFKPIVTWTLISGGGTSFRYCNKGFILGHKGPGIHAEENKLNVCLSLLNSNVAEYLLDVLAPTIGFEVGQVSKLPVLNPGPTSNQAVELARNDWDSFETSWDFQRLPWLPLYEGARGEGLGVRNELEPAFPNPSPLTPKPSSLEFSWQNWQAHTRAQIQRMQELETENNRLFIEAYGLQDELSPEVPIEQITLTCNPYYRYKGERGEGLGISEKTHPSPLIPNPSLQARMRYDAARELISYAIGCMMGRYRLDRPGLIYAHAGNERFWEIYEGIRGEGLGASDEGQGTSNEGNNDDQELSRLNRLEKGNGLGGENLSSNPAIPEGRTIWPDQPDQAGGGIHSIEHSGGSCAAINSGVSQFPVDCSGIAGGSGNTDSNRPSPGLYPESDALGNSRISRRDFKNAECADSQTPLNPRPSPLAPNPFPPDADGILPLTDEHWFEDDAAQRIRDFLLAVWPEEGTRDEGRGRSSNAFNSPLTPNPSSLSSNMAWLAESLGKKASETPEETLRRYLSDKFFKDHLQTYKKRPIYWLFSSGKQGAFQALVYLHRYHEGTLARMRNEYVIPLAGKIAGRIEFLEQEVANAPSTAARNKAQKNLDALRKKQAELAAYDEQLRHYADLRIALDLDDGVKVNYGKFGNLLAEVKAVTGGSADD